MQKILSHSRNDKYDDSVANLQKDWQILREKSRDGRELICCAMLYGDMPDANGCSNWSSDCREGLELILSRFNDHPEEAAAFNELLKRGISIPTAAKIFNTLPQSLKQGDFEQTAALFQNDSNSYFYWSLDKVELADAPVPGTTLKDRIGLIYLLARLDRSSESSEESWKNMRDDFAALKDAGGNAFPAGKLQGRGRIRDDRRSKAACKRLMSLSS